MKDSGVEWIGKIPRDWSVECLKYIYNKANVGESIDKDYTTDDDNDYVFYTAGLKPIHTKYCDFPRNKYTKEHDLLLARNGTPYVYLPNNNSVYSDHIIRISIENNVDRRFVRYSLQQAIESLKVEVVSIATWSISLWKKQKLPLPQLVVQQRIADYLDSKCSQIDSIIEKQKQIIEKLKEYKTSLITEVVTKGLDPNVEMKDSGVDFILKIPANWNVSPIRYLFSLREEKNYKQLKDVNLLSLYTDLGVFPHGEQEERGNKAVTADGYKVVYKDDIVVNIILAWMGAIGISDYNGVTSPAYDVYKPNKMEINKWRNYG